MRARSACWSIHWPQVRSRALHSTRSCHGSPARLSAAHLFCCHAVAQSAFALACCCSGVASSARLRHPTFLDGVVRGGATGDYSLARLARSCFLAAPGFYPRSMERAAAGRAAAAASRVAVAGAVRAARNGGRLLRRLAPLLAWCSGAQELAVSSCLALLAAGLHRQRRVQGPGATVSCRTDMRCMVNICQLTTEKTVLYTILT